MEIRIRSEQSVKIGLPTINQCFNCTYVMDYDWTGSGYDTYHLKTIENQEVIINRLKEKGFTEIKVKTSRC